MTYTGVFGVCFIPITLGQGYQSFYSPLLGHCTSTRRAGQRTSQEKKENMPELMWPVGQLLLGARQYSLHRCWHPGSEPTRPCLQLEGLF